jgi:hypothetical protein
MFAELKKEYEKSIAKPDLKLSTRKKLRMKHIINLQETEL